MVYCLRLPVGVGGPDGSGCVSMLGPIFACSARGPRGCIRGEVCGAGPNPLRPPSEQSAPTVLCRARRGVPGHASCVLAVPVFSSEVFTRDYRAHATVAPPGWGWACCVATLRRHASAPQTGATGVGSNAARADAAHARSSSPLCGKKVGLLAALSMSHIGFTVA